MEVNDDPEKKWKFVVAKKSSRSRDKLIENQIVQHLKENTTSRISRFG